jgi:hypothetical protein
MTEGTEKLGTENIKKVLSFGMGVAKSVADAKADGHVNVRDAPLFLDDVIKIPGVIKAAPKAYDEYLDLDDTEKAEIRVWFKDEFDCPDDKVEELIEAAFDAAIVASELIASIITLANLIKALK